MPETPIRMGSTIHWLDAVCALMVAILISLALGGPISMTPDKLVPLRLSWVFGTVLALVALRRIAGPFTLTSRYLSTWALLKSTRVSVLVAVVSRMAVFLVGLLCFVSAVPATGVGLRSVGYGVPGLPGHWDASWYVGLAAGGYRWQPNHPNSRLAFFPAFPMSLRAVARILHLPQTEPAWLWAGVLLSTVFFALALSYVYRLAHERLGPGHATYAVLLIATYPFALFFGQVYSESLFLLTAAASTYYLWNDRVAAASFWGIVAGLTRPTGCLVSLLLLDAGVSRTFGDRASVSSRRLGARILAVLSPALGTLLYSAYVRMVTGAWLTWLTDQAGWGRTVKNPIAVVRDLLVSVHSAGVAGYVMHQPYELMNVAAGVAGLCLAVPVARRVGYGAALFVVLGIIGPFRVGGFASMGRYTAVLFPIFLWLSTIRPRWCRAFAIAGAVGELALAALFFTDHPVF